MKPEQLDERPTDCPNCGDGDEFDEDFIVGDWEESGNHKQRIIGTLFTCCHCGAQYEVYF